MRKVQGRHRALDGDREVARGHLPWVLRQAQLYANAAGREVRVVDSTDATVARVRPAERGEAHA